MSEQHVEYNNMVVNCIIVLQMNHFLGLVSTLTFCQEKEEKTGTAS